MADGRSYRHQFQHLGRVRQGGQKIDFSLEEFPHGNARLTGKAQNPDGPPIENFVVDIRRKVEEKSETDYFVFGYKISFFSPDGRFEIGSLPADNYRISITPINDQGRTDSDRAQRYECRIEANQLKELKPADAVEKVWYGRVLFADGAPAIAPLPELSTQIVSWTTGGNYPGQRITTVDPDGYFAAYLSDEFIAGLHSGQNHLTVNISPINWLHEAQKEKFPPEKLSLERASVDALNIARPKVYYGRILYEDGQSVFPDPPPWPGAECYLVLRYTDATSRDPGITERLDEVDREGYFRVYLTDKEMTEIKAGAKNIQIYMPSYEDKYTSGPAGYFPPNLLNQEKNTAGVFKIPRKK